MLLWGVVSVPEDVFGGFGELLSWIAPYTPSSVYLFFAIGIVAALAYIFIMTLLDSEPRDNRFGPGVKYLIMDE